MECCVSCGHALGVGRFCVNCGHPVGAPAPTDDDRRTSTAHRPATQTLTAPTPPPGPPRGGHHHRGPRRWVPWAVSLVALALAGSAGVRLLTSGGDGPGDRAAGPTRAASPTPSPGPSQSPTPSGSPTDPATAAPQDVARLATAAVPATAPPNQDVDGNSVRYDARNLLDGVPETAWRMPGDGTGAEITFALDAPTRLTEVGLVNGYAKTATDAGGQRLDWYRGNRHVLAVEWVFDDGSTVSQFLEDTRGMQTVEIDPLTTSTVVLRLVSVSPPGSGRAARDYTPISDVTLVGTPP